MRKREELGIVDFLCDNKIITPDIAKEIEEEHEDIGDDIGSILIKRGIVNSDTLILLLIEALKNGIILLSEVYTKFSIDIDVFIEKFAQSRNCDYIDLFSVDVNYTIGAKIGYERISKIGVLPYKEDDLNIYIAAIDPFDMGLQDSLHRIFRNKLIKVAIANPDQIAKHLHNIEISESVKDLISEIRQEFKASDANDEESSGILKLIELILKTAIISGASDIHIEPTETNCIIRARIDGMLKEIFVFDKDMFPPLGSRVKLLGNLDIAEKRKPQDGRFSATIMDKHYDFRMSTLPIMTGESIVMRILDKSKVMIKLEDLGMHPENFKKFRAAMDAPYGVIFVTGPTGSGKSTTLYAGMNAIKSVKRKMITVEDPVEYQMSLLQQVQVNNKANLTFASALRSILRQDPDIIMIGEVRDKETLKIAIEASLTGHLVLTTLHTNDAVSAITRIIDMGIEAYLVSGALIAIQAQRLIRKVCPHCKVKTILPEEILKDMKDFIPETYQFYKAKGCDKCMQTGYSGRDMVSEVLVVDENMQSMIARGVSKEDILEYALENGFVTMFEDAAVRAAIGKTTIEEVYRVTKS
ncbi:MAG TPA: type II/IV secretion system protein [Campylobacterales bacterium]|nr:type II/IV secretion system protein [Campylobacterales bacterium]HIP59296.1 type II/IV secretion system protein [Campylobacterales bacterium]